MEDPTDDMDDGEIVDLEEFYSEELSRFKRGKRRAFVLGMALIGTVWLGQSLTSTPHTDYHPTETQKVYVTDTVTKEVPREVSAECTTYIEAVQKLRNGQQVLSKSKGEMQRVLDDVQINLFVRSGLKVKELQEEMNTLQQTMNNAWVDIGDASATIDSYDGTHDNPCMK